MAHGRCDPVYVASTLGLGAVGWSEWFAVLIVGGGIAALVHWLFGFTWPMALQACLAVLFVLPLFIKTLIANPRIWIGQMVVIGMPAFLVSRFALGFSIVLSSAYGLAMAMLLPLAVVRTLILFHVVDAPEPPSHRGSRSLWESESYGTTFTSGSPGTGASSPISTRR